MKRLNLLIFALAAAIMFFGCEKEEVVAPETGEEALAPDSSLEELENGLMH